jgi:hypothetical protein
VIDLFIVGEVVVAFIVIFFGLRWLSGWLRRRDYAREREQLIDGTTIDWRRMGEHRRRYDEAQRGER